MPDICTASANPSGCGHYNITVTVDGTPVALHVSNDELLEPLTTAEIEKFVLLSARRLRQQGVTLAQFLNRVTHGEEPTSVKNYCLVAPGSAVTKTNIGAAYVNILTGTTGQAVPVDFTGCTQFRILADATQIGTGVLGVQVVRHTDSAVLYANAAFGSAGAGDKALDTDWVTLPAQATGLILVRAQAKSTVATDDPVIRRVLLGVR